jgi:hypothetical protein
VSTPRYENRCLQSEAMATAPWVAGTGVSRTNNSGDVVDPKGGNTATKLVYDGSGGQGGFFLAQTIATVAIGEQLASGLWVRTANGTVTLRTTSNVGLEFVSKVVGTTWAFLETDAVAAVGGAWQATLYRDLNENAPRTLYVAFAQAAKRASVGNYVKTAASAVIGPSFVVPAAIGIRRGIA